MTGVKPDLALQKLPCTITAPAHVRRSSIPAQCHQSPGTASGCYLQDGNNKHRAVALTSPTEVMHKQGNSLPAG